MSIVLSMETFNRLEEKLGTEAAKELYSLAEAIYEEVEKKTEAKINNYKLDFADDGYKRLTRKEISEFKEDLMNRQHLLKEEFNQEVGEKIKKASGINIFLLIVTIVNFLGIAGILIVKMTGA